MHISILQNQLMFLKSVVVFTCYSDLKEADAHELIDFWLTIYLCFSTSQKQPTHAIQLHYYKLTVYKLFSNFDINQHL